MFGWTFTRVDILYPRRCRLDSGRRGSFRISSLVRVSFLLGSRVSAAVLVWEGDEGESGGDGGEGGGGGGGSGGEGPTTLVLSSNRDCWMISLTISCARSVAMSVAISMSAICSARLSLASDMLRRRRSLVARPSSKNGPGEGARILAGAVRTASHLENERGPEGDLGEGHSESEVGGDLLRSAESTAPALAREEGAEEIRLLSR